MKCRCQGSDALGVARPAASPRGDRRRASLGSNPGTARQEPRMDDRSVTRLVGVYDADGGLLGEAAYAWGKARGTRHCALCDITHSPWRRKPAWDAMAAEL